jgi:hypothetical protein
MTLADKTYGTPGGVLETARPSGEGTSHEHGDEVGSGKKPSTSIHDGSEQRSKSKLEEEYGFAHPAVSRPQRTVWIPQDTLGLADEEQRACAEAGVDASTKDAEMNEKGKVDISGPPPDVVLEE